MEVVTFTDILGLSKQTIFKNLSDYFSKMNPKTRSLMDCSDSMLFVWNCEDSYLWALNIKSSESSDFKTMHQTLLPTNPPSFEVERVKANRTSSHVLAFGSLGIVVFELPRRWGKFGMFQGGKSEVMCRSRIVDERFFRCNPHVVVKQVRWHPGSATDTHILVLSSENTFRFYQVAGDQPTLLKVWTVGRRPTSTRVPILVGLGDTCVDFDFALPSFESYDSDDRSVTNSCVTWPLYALQGNGDVYAIKMSRADMSSSVDVKGPLCMFPQADDNYGGDACSILCLQSNPPIVIVATCSGTIYHTLVLSSEDDEGSWNDTTLALYVFEIVELELGLGLKDDDDIYACPILLHHDDTAVSRYFCSHDTGVHVMMLPMVDELERYAEAKNEETDLLMPLMKEASSAQYLICTRTSSSSPLAPVQALTIGTSPPILICLLTTGEVVSVALVSNTTFHASSLVSKDHDQGAGLETQRDSFVEHIQRLLQRSTSQPLLKLAPTAEPSAQECLELVSRATNVLRDEYLQKQFQVCDEMQRKVRMLRTMKEHQLKELSSMEDSRQQLKESAEHLAEKYEDIKDKQEEMARRAERVLRAASTRQPAASAAEKQYAARLQEVQGKLGGLKLSLEQVRARHEYHRAQLDSWRREQDLHKSYLSDAQHRVISENLASMSRNLYELCSFVGNALKIISNDPCFVITEEHSAEK
ncbi:nucleoporin 88 isoform X3 [Bacillus rossius redtenbacheri]|uniref:nucleoporin 88 isoform X3 n=1 Tax=Bacillus rossius redtenbacheri TaxID=93214 RepID=UPI002FDE111C